MAETIRATRPEPPPHVSAEVDVAHTPIVGRLLGGGIYRAFFRNAYRA